MKMPYGQLAYVEEQKLFGYLFHSGGKGRDFEFYGYTLNYAEDLRELLLQIARECDYQEKESDEFGDYYTFFKYSLSPNIKGIPLYSVWQVSKTDRKPRLVTAYPYPGYRRRDL